MTTNDKPRTFVLEQSYITPEQAWARAALAVGYSDYSAIQALGDAKGERVHVEYKKHAIGGPRWVTSYHYAGTTRLYSGVSFVTALQEAVNYYRANKGASVIVTMSADDPNNSVEVQFALLRFAEFVEGKLDTPSWWTNEHEAQRSAGYALDTARFARGARR